MEYSSKRKEPSHDDPGRPFSGVVVQPPEEFQTHELVAGRLFYAIPRQLIELLATAPHRPRLDPDLIQLERAISEAAGSACGFWNGRPVRSTWLNPPPPLQQSSLANADAPGWSDEFKRSLAANATRLDEKLNSHRRPLLGYLGWLLTNPQFLSEHDKLCGRHRRVLEESGMLRMGAVDRSSETQQHQGVESSPGVIDFELMARSQSGDSSRSIVSEQTEAVIDKFVQEFTSFYIRWRLQDCDGPYLPVPLTPQLPVRHLPAVLGHMKEGGRSYYLPDTFPVPSRDALRDLIEESLRQPFGSPRHLKQWQDIVNGDQVAKNQVQRFARLFRLQHYSRALYSRHEAFLQYSKTHLHEAFSQFLGASDRSVERDFAFIDERLGTGWETRPLIF